MNESVSKRVTSTSNADSYHWKGFIRFDSIGQGLFCTVLIGDGKNVPDRINNFNILYWLPYCNSALFDGRTA